MHGEYHVVIKYYSQTHSIGGGCQPLTTDTGVAEEWTSMVLRVNKHNFCFVVIEFQLVYVHAMTYISDTVLYTQPCNIDITILERYVELSIIGIDTKWDLEQSPAGRSQSNPLPTILYHYFRQTEIGQSDKNETTAEQLKDNFISKQSKSSYL